MKKRFQVILSFSVLIIVVLGFTGFASLTYKYVADELIKQILNDNRVIGEEILRLLNKTGLSMEKRSDFVNTVQNICDESHLPNGGYICAVDAEGNVIAAPGLKDGSNMHFRSAEFLSFGTGKNVKVLDFINKNRFEGTLRSRTMDTTDIIVALPITGKDITLFVHQNKAEVYKKAKQYVRPLIFLGLISGTILALFVYIVVNQEVNRYEDKLEVLNRDLVISNAKLAETSNERKQLIHILSHDLTNPLGSISTAVELYKMDKSDETLELILEMIEKGVSNGLGIIELVRQIHALESGKIELELVKINLKEAVESSYETLKSRFKDKEIVFKNNISEDIEVKGEIVSLHNSVLNNILTNAVKFSERGSVIEAESYIKEDRAVLVIRDFGIGIPERIRKNLFNMGYKTSRNGTEGESGTGFGMPLVKKFMEAYGGGIEVRSVEAGDKEAGHGTEMILYFVQ